MFTVDDLTQTRHAGDLRVDALLDPGPNWNYLLPTRSTLTYTFDLAYAGSSHDAPALLATPVAFNADQMAATRGVLAYVASVTGVAFAEVPSAAQADLHFAAADVADPAAAGLCSSETSWSYDGSNAVTRYSAEAVVFLDNAQHFGQTQNPAVGTAAYQVLLHEVGHALGLGHPFGNVDPALRLSAADDNTGDTVMSYTWTGATKSTLQSYDLLALRWLYGEDGLGGNWGFNSTNGPSLSLTPPSNAAPMTGTPNNDNLVGGAGAESFQGDWLAGLAGGAQNQVRLGLVGLLDTGLEFQSLP